MLSQNQSRYKQSARNAHPLMRLAHQAIDERLQDIKQVFTKPSHALCSIKGEQAHDLVTSCLEITHEELAQGSLSSIYNALLPDGLFMGVMIGGQSLFELRTCLMDAEIALSGGASPRVVPMIGGEEAGNALLQAGFSIPVIDSQRIEISYPDIYALMNDLRACGCANKLEARTRKTTKRALFSTAQKLYATRFPASGSGIMATFDLIFMHGWREDLDHFPER